jgi:hypothetical protein
MKMARKRMTVRDILKKNPQIDANELKRNQALAEELSRMGMQRRGYQLPPLFERRRVMVCDDNDDPRVINLSASRK